MDVSSEYGIASIGIHSIGTESALDMGRPLSAFVAERLGLQGAVRSSEVKHACYGGTLAFSYGSGCGAELLTLIACSSTERAWEKDVQKDLATREEITAEIYDTMRDKN